MLCPNRMPLLWKSVTLCTLCTCRFVDFVVNLGEGSIATKFAPHRVVERMVEHLAEFFTSQIGIGIEHLKPSRRTRADDNKIIIILFRYFFLLSMLLISRQRLQIPYQLAVEFLSCINVAYDSSARYSSKRLEKDQDEQSVCTSLSCSMIFSHSTDAKLIRGMDLGRFMPW